ncbi:DUF6790 family protein [Lutibaculum baratangense]|uniref:Formate hydrogenlyase subunit 3/Multisubunit Na+/H+ antiporter, MnhD subunit n=1 Tax=Lutibaculum baratangense AMV1 TaxID=631454 RepID=V4RJ59_9HYPH|nr:DUF6790 family protein [Lutibaculum baratangense]ESR23305.1 Formate hydrogenlyase subunit 3/Multisubunit Na+/H+ antiporter, MnhD subunit [Lutibaculum baratangense AMV1]
MIGQAIALVLSNFTATFFVLGVVAAVISITVRRGWTDGGRIAEEFLAFYLLFNIFLSFFYNFVMHVFFGDMAASFIGWQNSPFQAEVGFASLGFAVVGLMAFRAGAGLRLAAVVGPACFLLGAAGGHVYQMITAHNFAPGNAGAIFWTDILIPLLGLALVWWRHHREPGRRHVAASA